ncbi:aminotransferase class I/II-fold pyridoxal phosphate-dependent enzyme [Samsonia erythrinae]|uniref:Aminotransferase n=1 Tax=Samsonia erythrinae TaxID=160434 RepID=A0A4R3VTY6_9GAMM|nr:aminotransferase class I/II-fold pyridoxal phosphate-dependent enzyme [Samsonia erythrinae]TCV07704.1 histidinol phosphate aminotransferase [Samsonia erythrinae]
MKRVFARECVQKMEPAFSFPNRSEDRGMVNLRDNENPFGGEEKRYPDNMTTRLAECYLRALDIIENRENNVSPLGTENVLLTRGASDALDLIFRAFFEPARDRIITTPPNFKLFDELATVYAIENTKVDLLGDRFNQLDVHALCAQGAKGVILCDPNNPMGSSLDHDNVVRLLKTFEGIVVIDEAYVEYAERESFRHLIMDYDNLIVVRSMSKALGMAGLRLGALLAQETLIKILLKVRLPFALPRPVLLAAEKELSKPQKLQSQIQQFIQERERFASLLRNCPGIDDVFSFSGFITVKAKKEIAERLLQSGFDVLPNPMGVRGYIRISVGSPDITDRVLQILKTQ